MESIDGVMQRRALLSLGGLAVLSAAAASPAEASAPGSRVVACALRNTGSGFGVIQDAGHAPMGVRSVVTAPDDMSVRVNLDFRARTVGAVIAAPDETLAAAGYAVGPSVGLDSVTLYASQPAGFGDYIYWDGRRWVSLNGFISGVTMNGRTGLITCTHADMAAPYGGSVTSRSLTKRASMEGISATSTTLFLVDSAGRPVRKPTKDSRFWVTRTGARRVPMSELAKPGANIWVYGVLEV